MNLDSWQAGLFLGAAFMLVLDFGVRWRLRIRKRRRCLHCTGILGDDDRAEFPVERLVCCAWCGDTWPEGKRPEHEAPGYRDKVVAITEDTVPLAERRFIVVDQVSGASEPGADGLIGRVGIDHVYLGFYARFFPAVVGVDGLEVGEYVLAIFDLGHMPGTYRVYRVV